MLPNEFGWLIAMGSIIVNLILTIISARVQSGIAEVKVSVAEVKVDIEKVRTEMQTLRAGMLEKQFDALADISNKMRESYMDRDTSMSMHKANQARLDSIEEHQSRIIEMLSGRGLGGAV